MHIFMTFRDSPFLFQTSFFKEFFGVENFVFLKKLVWRKSNDDVSHFGKSRNAKKHSNKFRSAQITNIQKKSGAKNLLTRVGFEPTPPKRPVP